jgi:hypothetical protein
MKAGIKLRNIYSSYLIQHTGWLHQNDPLLNGSYSGEAESFWGPYEKSAHGPFRNRDKHDQIFHKQIWLSKITVYSNLASFKYMWVYVRIISRTWAQFWTGDGGGVPTPPPATEVAVIKTQFSENFKHVRGASQNNE